jgi:hypothetical protein
MTTMDDNTAKEQFSRAYVRAVGVGAKAEAMQPETDRDSVDLIIKKVGSLGEQLDLQLKCTADPVPQSGDLSFALPIKNYNDLRKATATPRLLVVVYVPTDLNEWFDCSEEHLLLRRCGWWLDLRGMPDSNNTASVTVTLPRENRFTPEALNALFSNIAGTFQFYSA